MQRDPNVYLEHMRQACVNIRVLLNGRVWEEYIEDATLRWAVERQMSILGEAAYQLNTVFPDLAERIPDASRIVKFRHVIIHGYATVDDDLVWKIVQERIPELEAVLDKLLEE